MENGQFMEEGGIKAGALKQVSAGKAGKKEAERQAEGLTKVLCREDEKAKGNSVGEKKKTDSADSLRKEIAAIFPGRHQDIRSYSALSLAYIGDVVYDLIIRTVVVAKGNRPVNDLHRITVKYVSATAQAKMVKALSEILTEEEKAIFQRGKNSKPHTTAKNARVSDYLKATGFEAVIGYLYLTDNMGRALELVKKGIALAGMEI